MRRRDLLTNLGGLPSGCYIDSKSYRDFKRDPANRFGVLRFFLAIRSEKVRQAQDDIQKQTQQKPLLF